MKIYLNDAKGNLHFKCQTIMSQTIQMLQDCSLSGYGFLPHAADTVLTQDLGALEPAKHRAWRSINAPRSFLRRSYNRQTEPGMDHHRYFARLKSPSCHHQTCHLPTFDLGGPYMDPPCVAFAKHAISWKGFGARKSAQVGLQIAMKSRHAVILAEIQIIHSNIRAYDYPRLFYHALGLGASFLWERICLHQTLLPHPPPNLVPASWSRGFRPSARRHRCDLR